MAATSSQARTLDWPSRFAIGLLVFQLIASATAVLAWSALVPPSASISDLELPRRALGCVALGKLVLFVPTVVVFLLWFYRTYASAQQASPLAPSRSPAAAVWSFFVPFLNLFVPVEILFEIWTILELPRRYLPLLWWLSFIGGGLAGNLALAVTLTADPSAARFIAFLSVVSSSLLAIAAVAAILVIRTVGSRPHPITAGSLLPAA